jgi:hypothetical protein
MRKVNRQYVILKKMTDEEDSFVSASSEEMFLSVWDLTEELWSLRGSVDVKRRLQRNITRLIKK